MNRKENVIIWGFFSIVFIGSYLILMQQNESIANNAYLISAFISLSLTFILDRVLKNRTTKAEAKNLKVSPSEKKGSSEKKKSNKNKELTSHSETVSTKNGKNQNSKKKKKK